MSKFTAPIFGIALLSVAPANAQHPLILERLNSWNAAAPQPSMDTLEAQVQDKANSIYEGNDVCSAAPIVIEKVQPATADGVVFNGLIRGTMRNAWFVSTNQPACDENPSRYLVMQNADQSFRTIRVNRGVAYAWESLIGDTLPAAKLAARIVLKKQGEDCASGADATLGVVRIADGSAAGPEVFGIRYSGSWAEIWPISLCDKTVEVFVSFRADGDGGAHFDLLQDKSRIVS